MLRNRRGRDSERPAHRDEEWPPLAATRESPHTVTKTRHSQINKLIKKKTNTKNKENIFNLTVQYLEKYSSTVQQLALLSSTSYITAAFTLASRPPGLEIKILYYCTLYNTVKYTKAQPLVEDACT